MFLNERTQQQYNLCCSMLQQGALSVAILSSMKLYRDPSRQHVALMPKTTRLAQPKRSVATERTNEKYTPLDDLDGSLKDRCGLEL